MRNNLETHFSAYAFSRKAVATNLLNKMAEKNKPIQAEESAKTPRALN